MLSGGRVLRVLYTNGTGHRSSRRIVPDRLWYGSTERHRSPQWLLEAYDVDQDVSLTVPIASVAEFGDDTPEGVPDRHATA